MEFLLIASIVLNAFTCLLCCLYGYYICEQIRFLSGTNLIKKSWKISEFAEWKDFFVVDEYTIGWRMHIFGDPRGYVIEVERETTYPSSVYLQEKIMLSCKEGEIFAISLLLGEEVTDDYPEEACKVFMIKGSRLLELDCQNRCKYLRNDDPKKNILNSIEKQLSQKTGR